MLNGKCDEVLVCIVACMILSDILFFSFQIVKTHTSNYLPFGERKGAQSSPRSLGRLCLPKIAETNSLEYRL